MAEVAPDFDSFAGRLRETGLSLERKNWESDMLEVIERGSARFNQIMGHPKAVELATGGVLLSLTLTGGGLAYPLWYLPPWKHISFGIQTLRQEPRWRGEVAVVHEIAHEWDFQSANLLERFLPQGGRSVKGMVAYVGAEPGPTCYGGLQAPECGFPRMVKEEWAESVASYLYPEYIDWLRDHLPSEKQAGLRPLHRQYVEMQIELLRQKFDRADS
jgi:hypothetical protein